MIMAPVALMGFLFAQNGQSQKSAPPDVVKSGTVPAIPAQPFPGQGIPAIPAIPALPSAKSTASCPKVSEFSMSSLLDKSWSIKNPQPVLREGDLLYTYWYFIQTMFRSKSGALFVGGFTADSNGWVAVMNKSTDNGATWSRIEMPRLSAPQSWNMVFTITEDNSGTMYAGGTELWKSSDGGNTWSALPSPYPRTAWWYYNIPVTSLLVTKDNALIAVSSADEGTMGGIYLPSKVVKSVDGGKTWSELFTHRYYITSVVEAADGSLVFRDSEYGNTGGAYRYAGGAVTKTLTDGVAAMELNAGILKASDGTMYLVSGDPAVDLYSGTEYTEPGHALLAAFKSTDNGASWIKLGTLPDSWTIQSTVVEAADGTLYATSFSVCTGNNVVYKSVDKGASWSVVAKAPKFGSGKSIDDRYYYYVVRSFIKAQGGGVLIGGNAPVIFSTK